jgi:hypothetical protein
MLPEFPPQPPPEPPASKPWRFWPDFWKGFGLCLLFCVLLGTACILAIGLSFKIDQNFGTVVMVGSTLMGLVPLALVTLIAFRRRPSGQRAGWIVGGALCYAFLTLLPIVICFGAIAIASGMK